MRPNRLCVSGLLLFLAYGPLAISEAVESQWVRTGAAGRLIYVPDAEGDRVLDFSAVGYQARGAQLIPALVPAVVTVSPVAGDDTANLQAAIDSVATLAPGPDGFRGAVLLGAGDYDIATQLNITASGIVLRGVGREVGQTVLHGRGTSQRSLVNIVGAGSPSFSGKPKRNMIDKVVPVGATSFRVDSTSGLAVGDTVRVERPSTANWIAAVGMDNPPDGDPPWQPNTMNIRYDRVITRIEGNRVFLDAPLANSFELQYGGGTIQTYSWADRIEKIGIENLRAESDFASDTDEAHAWNFVSIENAQNVWIRHTTSRYFGNSAVVSNPTAKWVTVDDAINLDPKSLVTGERRYTFDLSGQLDYVTRSQANSGRHDFVNNSTRPPGPHVFHNSVANNALNDSGPHQRWATGSLFDNITVNGNNIDARNRGSLGTTHGWSGANMVIWNSQAAGYIVQNPPTAQNWLIGSTGAIIEDTQFGPQPLGYIDSHGTAVTVGGTNSLYEAQLNDSSEIRTVHWAGGSGSWTDALQWHEGVTPGVYRVSMRDYLVGDIDNYVFDGASSVDAAFIDPSWRAEIQNSSALPISSFDDVNGDRNVAFTIQRQVTTGERVVHGFLALALKRSTSGDAATDFLQLFDMDSTHRFGFSDLGWDAQLTPSSTFVGVVDLGSYRDQLQTGLLNVQVNDDAGLDWALYVATVATPIADAQGPTVVIDGGGIVFVQSTVAGLHNLQLGGMSGSTLRLQNGGSIEIHDNFEQLANGTLVVELGADTSGALIELQGSAVLAGNLSVQLGSGFVPSLDVSYRIISAANGVLGQFDSLALPDLAYGMTWALSYHENAVDLLVVASYLSGDYNHDGMVDAADYLVYRAALGESGSSLAADGNGNGQIDEGDYTVWRANFGQSTVRAGVASLSVPEPVWEVGLLALVLGGSGRRSPRRRRDTLI